jgi:multidrug efflux pump subunit AcrA (membrane-fusion protein)
VLRNTLNRSSSRRFAFAMSAIAFFLIALAFIPVTFNLPVEGRVKPKEHRRIFAPAEAVVTEILVRNGQAIKEGEPMFQLRSAALELREEQLRGDLLTAKTKLASLGATRSTTRPANGEAASTSLGISSSEESLKAEIAGLEKQLTLIESQKQDLRIKSPLRGIVDRWDLDQSLAMRPVAPGQHLVDVYSPTGPWIVELDLPDKYVTYLATQELGHAVKFRLKSRPDRTYEATLTEIAKSTQLDAQSRVILRLKCGFTPKPAEPLAVDATVWADIDCGKRSLGFVWFRGLVEWYERQTWY